MKRILIFITICHSLFLNAQQRIDTEVRFETALTWDMVKQKAAQENKFIFVDIFATWCAPCKQMDKVVYTSNDVAQIINKYFISVKVQMDTTNADGASVKGWYPVAHSFQEKYKIGAYPTYLFFTSTGKILHRESGFKMPDDFVKVINDAIEPKKQLYTQLEKYKKGIKDYRAMPSLAKNVYLILNDYELAFQIADDYNKNFLNKLNNDQLLNKDNIEFISWYPKVLHTNDKYFNLFLNNSNTVDSLMGKHGFSSRAIDGAIIRDEIFSEIYRSGKPISGMPDWEKMFLTIKNKYGIDRADRTILNARIGWYTRKKEWSKAIKFNILQIEKTGIDTSVLGKIMLNNLCYDLIFKYASDTTDLKKAITWMEQILKYDPDDATYIDTYANLLYKAGRKSEAIFWQEKAIKIDPDNEGLKDCFNKMKRNQPTWPK